MSAPGVFRIIELSAREGLDLDQRIRGLTGRELASALCARVTMHKRPAHLRSFAEMFTPKLVTILREGYALMASGVTRSMA
jgi:hypothetical protein